MTFTSTISSSQEPDPTTLVCSMTVVLKAQNSSDVINIIPNLTGYRGFFLVQIFLLFLVHSCKLILFFSSPRRVEHRFDPVTADIAVTRLCWLCPVPHCHLVETICHYRQYNGKDLKKKQLLFLTLNIYEKYKVYTIIHLIIVGLTGLKQLMCQMTEFITNLSRCQEKHKNLVNCHKNQNSKN